MQIEAVKQRSGTKSAAICLPSNLSLHTSARRQTDVSITWCPSGFLDKLSSGLEFTYLKADREWGNRLAKLWWIIRTHNRSQSVCVCVGM